jgi:hypothetical protein
LLAWAKVWAEEICTFRAGTYRGAGEVEFWGAGGGRSELQKEFAALRDQQQITVNK